MKETLMIRIMGNRGVSAVTGLFFLAFSSTQAVAAPSTVAQAVAGHASAYANALATPTVARVVNAVATLGGSIIQQAAASSVTLSLAPNIAKEASWLQKNGWPLYALVDRYAAGAPLDEQANCIAVAVYHEARGESLEGQLAVARVIMNRAASGKYPTSWCGTVKQPWQFSFVNPRTGDYPRIDEASESWKKALGITRLAVTNAVQTLPGDVLWYHADYVAPGWGKRLTKVEKIGTHIFYRA
jgi:spore germination cell wall hydrolase CwlJ-like protein